MSIFNEHGTFTPVWYADAYQFWLLIAAATRFPGQVLEILLEALYISFSMTSLRTPKIAGMGFSFFLR